MQGILLINKPKDKSSFYFVSCFRKILGEKKIGHAGTLDPFATGVLVLLVGKKYTRMSNQFLCNEKHYEAQAMFGVKTDTFDLEGQEIAKSSFIPSFEEVQNCLKKFQGEITQIPPMFSAKKIGGKKLYELARKGLDVERKPCKVKVEIELVSYNYPLLTFKVIASKGTYIRSLADDIGSKLGCFAHLVNLKRTYSTPFSIEQCLDFEKFKAHNFDIALLHESEDGFIKFNACLI
jgi:tRNA pseudouridine55 synthase